MFNRRDAAQQTDIRELSDDDLLDIIQDGIKAALDGRSLLDSAYLDDTVLLAVWMEGYMRADPESLPLLRDALSAGLTLSWAEGSLIPIVAE
jgi:hypothetical protein